jgi:glycerate 2-kinase
LADESRLKRVALEVFREAIKKMDPDNLLNARLVLNGRELTVLGERFDLDSFSRVSVIAIGKAAPRMAVGLEKALPGLIHQGLVLSNDFSDTLPGKYKTFKCSHPLPGRANVDAGSAVLGFAGRAGKDHLVIVAVSGGGSSILAVPAEGISLEEKRETTRLLLVAGARIDELNTVRKHLSAVKGGRLQRAIAPAATLGLYLSDVPGDDPSTIASGPTAPDPTTFADALAVIEKYGLTGKIPGGVAERLRRGRLGELEETPKEGGPEFSRCNNIVVGCNRDMLSALEAGLRHRGFWTMTELDPYQGEAKEVGAALARKARALARSLPPGGRPYALICGGETTVTVRGRGLGGRNCELALGAAVELAGCRGCLVFAAGTDGIDGPTDAAGALADGASCDRAEKLGLDPLEHLRNNDSYNFFKPLEDLVVTGPTGTNLMDVSLVLVE